MIYNKRPELLRQEALDRAIYYNDVDTTRRLIDADPHWKVSNYALRYPVLRGDKAMYRLLREKGVDYVKMGIYESKKFRMQEKIMAAELRVEQLEEQMAEMKRELDLLRPKPPAPQARKPLTP